MPSPFTDCQALVGSCLWSFISGSRRNRLLSSKFGDWRDLPALFWAPMAGCNGHRNVLVLVCVDSDDHLNIAITFATGDSYHCYLLGDDAAVGTPAR